MGCGTASYEHGKTTGHPEDPWHSSEAASHYHSVRPKLIHMLPFSNLKDSNDAKRLGSLSKDGLDMSFGLGKSWCAVVLWPGA